MSDDHEKAKDHPVYDWYFELTKPGPRQDIGGALRAAGVHVKAKENPIPDNILRTSPKMEFHPVPYNPGAGEGGAITDASLRMENLKWSGSLGTALRDVWEASAQGCSEYRPRSGTCSRIWGPIVIQDAGHAAAFLELPEAVRRAVAGLHAGTPVGLLAGDGDHKAPDREVEGHAKDMRFEKRLSGDHYGCVEHIRCHLYFFLVCDYRFMPRP